MNLQLIDALQSGFIDKVWQLYAEAFPESERKLPKLLEDKYRIGKVDILAIVDENRKFLGEMITVKQGKLVLLDYFAICPDIRGGGIGSKALAMIREYYRDFILILEIESVNESSDNAEQRQRRKRFYLSNGFCSLDWEASLFGIRMEVLTYGVQIDFDSYHDIYASTFGRKLSDNVKLYDQTQN
ncbi:MAG TPA: GNAT family N-acetyltransferase [Firmicutes bacterium]|nr:GNAT family N-acetyltransferase [Bacillota bacterium]